MFLTKAERDFLLQRGEINKNQQRYIGYKLRRKIKHFYESELPLLLEQGYITVAGSVADNSCGMAACSHESEKKTSKNGVKDAQISDIFAASNFYASWSGGE